MKQTSPKDILQAWSLLSAALTLCDSHRGRKATKEEADFLIKALIETHYQSHLLGLRQSFVLCERLLGQLQDQGFHRVWKRTLTTFSYTMPKEVPLPDFESVYWQLQGIVTEFRKEMEPIRLTAVRPVSNNGVGIPETRQPLAVELKAATTESIQAAGRLRWRDGFREVWLGEGHYDLRKRTKARLCIQYLVEKQAFSSETARHLVGEIDPYVRKMGDYPPSVAIKIDHYFNDRNGRLSKLREELIQAAGRNGKYYLKKE
jgi:hypothetical protein